MPTTFIVLLGPPGVGKGTQASILAERTGLAHVSSGDLFRENIKKNTELGKLVKKILSDGELVPDDLTIAMIRNRLTRPDCEAGAILDGFPRTPAQADALQAMLAEFNGDVEHVPFINAPEDILVTRLSGRRTCRANGHIYHTTYNPPKRAGICDIDNSDLYQREDDQVDTVKRRIQVYMDQTAPLIEYYRRINNLQEIDGAQTIEAVTASLGKSLEN